MNIDEYRAWKAQQVEASQKDDQTQSTSKTEEKPKEDKPKDKPKDKSTVEEPKSQETKEDVKPVEEKIVTKMPEKVTIEGVGEVDFEELRKGYLRQSDYTKKTQEVSRKSKEVKDAVELFEHLKKNPELAQKLVEYNQAPRSIDPTHSEIIKLQNQMYDMKLEMEIESLQNKYPDFEAMEVLKVAKDRQIMNLEDAYLIIKSQKTPPKPESPEKTVDVETLKKQLREEVLREIEKEKIETKTIISSGATPTPIKDNTPKLSEIERKVARGMKMSDADYAKWRDKK